MARQQINLAQIRAALSAQTLMGFVLATYPTYECGWVHELICAELDNFLAAVGRRESPRLMLTMPPRHGKTELASRRFPAYVLGRNPDISIIATSYSADLAARTNRDVQRIIDDVQYRKIFPHTTLNGKNSPSSYGSYARNTDYFEIVDHHGVYRSAGVGGGITGMGADIILIDDPIKDRAEADSATYRRRVWDWYTSTLYTRLAPGGGIVLMLTRWHTDDLAGRLIAAQDAGGDRWRIVNFAAIAESDETPYRLAGEALHPERYNAPQLQAIRTAIGERDWAALYQQRPVPDGGAIFREHWLRYYERGDLPLRFDTMVASWDMSFKGGGDSDYVVGQVWGRSGANFYLLDQIRGRMDFTQTIRAVMSLSQKWPMAAKKLIEDTANGPAVISALRDKIYGIVPVRPDGSKIARAYAVTALFESGNVWLPAASIAPWVTDLTSEIMAFPASAHDDQVDAMTQALRSLRRNKSLNIDKMHLRVPYE